jgi:hypothetical protein
MRDAVREDARRGSVREEARAVSRLSIEKSAKSVGEGRDDRCQRDASVPSRPATM